MSKKVVICGMSPDSRDDALNVPPDYEVWRLNEAYTIANNSTRWFEMHAPYIYRWELRRPKGHLRWLQNYMGILYIPVADPELPNATVYPLDDVVRTVGFPFLTSSGAYMVGLAIHEGFTTIRLCGFAMSGFEYAHQRECMAWLLGLAVGRGISIEKPQGDGFLEGPFYGMAFRSAAGETVPRAEYEKHHKWLEAADNQYEREYETAVGMMHIVDGRVKQLEEIIRMGIVTNANLLNQRYTQLLRDLEHMKFEQSGAWSRWMMIQGGMNELKFWESQIMLGLPAAEYVPQSPAGIDAQIVAEGATLDEGELNSPLGGLI